MFRSIFSLGNVRKVLQASTAGKTEQIRTAFVLKRRWEPKLDKKYGKPKPLHRKNYIYDLVENTDAKKEPDLKLILTSNVEGIGMKNEVVSVRPNLGRNKLLLPGLAVYASPENLEKLKKTLEETKHDVNALACSSRFAELTKRDLSRWIIEVIVSQETPWTIEKWHVRSSFRRNGFWVPDHAITMPERQISGPNMDLENKFFLVTVKINNTETTPVRCMIRHWSVNPQLRPPYDRNVKSPPYSPVFEDERQLISELPLPTFCLPKGNAVV